MKRESVKEEDGDGKRQMEGEESDRNEEREEDRGLKTRRKLPPLIGCKSWLLNLWAATPKKWLRGRTADDYQITAPACARSARLPGQISEIRFPRWKSLRGSAVSSVAAAQSAAVPSPRERVEI